MLPDERASLYRREALCRWGNPFFAVIDVSDKDVVPLLNKLKVKLKVGGQRETPGMTKDPLPRLEK